jgi:hypothetical protein
MCLQKAEQLHHPGHVIPGIDLTNDRVVTGSFIFQLFNFVLNLIFWYPIFIGDDSIEIYIYKQK